MLKIKKPPREYIIVTIQDGKEMYFKIDRILGDNEYKLVDDIKKASLLTKIQIEVLPKDVFFKDKQIEIRKVL